MLDPLLLRSFVAIIDTGSFTRAGERVHLTQSTISQQIRRLEQQLGCPLLDRSGRQVVTTAEGEKLLGLARRILALLAEAEAQVTEASLQLSLGVPEDFAAGAIAPVLAQLAEGLASSEWNKAAIAGVIKQVITAAQVKMPQLAMPVRVLLLGTPQTPSLDAVIELMDRENVISRLKNSAGA
jgi:glutamyl/glutaminyl-tRNA synthetase